MEPTADLAAAPREPALVVATPTVRWAVPFGLALLFTLLFRLPPLINAAGVNSDAAIVGLQARHMLAGEWAANLWGAPYQASVDSALAALGFAVTGPGPLTLFSVPFLGMVLMVAIAFDIVRRRTSPWAALFAVTPLVFASMAINMPMVYLMRQTMITVMVAGIWLLDTASGSRRPLIRFAVGAALLGAGLFIDLFALVLVPSTGLFALACCLDSPRGVKKFLARTGAMLGGLAIGLVPYLALHRGGGAAPGSDFGRVRGNFELLESTCLPFALGTKVYVPGKQLYAQLWDAPAPVHVLQWVGASIFALGVLFGLVAFVLRRVPWEVRRLGLLGAAASVSAIGAFLISTMPSDMWSARYLAPILWTAPFALAPAAYLLRGKWLGPVMAPFIATAALGGWLSYGNYVDGPLPVRDPRGVAADERQLRDLLREKGVHYGAAQYWLSYRLTFLFDEDPVIVPLEAGEDRYAPYRRGFESAKKIAMIFHPSEPRAEPSGWEQNLQASGVKYERLEQFGFTVLLVDR